MDIKKLSALSLHVFLWTKLTTLTKSFVGSDLPPRPTFKKNSELECRRSAGHLAKHSLWHFHQLNHHLLHAHSPPKLPRSHMCRSAESAPAVQEFPTPRQRRHAILGLSLLSTFKPRHATLELSRLPRSHMRRHAESAPAVFLPRSYGTVQRRHADKLPSNSVSCQLPRSPGDQPSTMEPVPGMQDFPLRLLTRFKIVS